MSKKLTIDEFISKAKQVHGDRYDYSLVEYTNNKIKVKIICPEHGVFEQIPNNHISKKQGCANCSNIKRHTILSFITKAKQVHGDRYDYSLVEYTNNKIKVKIICPEHGVFEQRPDNHFQGFGCSECSGLRQMDNEIFISKSIKVHGNKYLYDLVKYENTDTKVKIICPEHGVFEQTPHMHLYGNGCISCAGTKKLTADEFISKAKQIHGDRYDYSLVEYTNSRTKVKIICPEHGEFSQTPSNHLSGQGCPICYYNLGSSKQELDLLDYIKSIYKGEIITNTRQIIYPYELDIYLPDIHKAFEYNGMYWHNEGLTKPVGYHQMKNDLCSHRGINLMHVWEHDWLNDNRFMKEMVRREIQL